MKWLVAFVHRMRPGIVAIMLANALKIIAGKKGIVEKMAQYIADRNSSVSGFSARNIWRMKQFFDNTTLTRAFSGKLARGIVNKFITRMQSHEKRILDYPIQNALTSAMRKESAKQNNTDFMSMWAGQAAYLCKALPAAQLIEELNNEVIALLKQSS
jgi:hypothetical protein